MTWDLTLETLITFLTIEKNNINNYIVNFEKRVMVTAFAILAMFPGLSEVFQTTFHSFQLTAAGRPRINLGWMKSLCCKTSEHCFPPFFTLFCFTLFFDPVKNRIYISWQFYEFSVLQHWKSLYIHRSCENCKMNEDCNKKVTFNVDLMRCVLALSCLCSIHFFIQPCVWEVICLRRGEIQPGERGKNGRN